MDDLYFENELRNRVKKIEKIGIKEIEFQIYIQKMKWTK